MMRITGFLLGVFLTVAMFLLLLRPDGLPQSGAGGASTPAGPAAGPAESFTADVEQWNTGVATATDPADVGRLLQSGEEPDAAEKMVVQDAAAQAVPAARVSLRGEAERHGADPTDAAATDRYLFWSPFRSEWAARGFARRLVTATGVPVEVIHAGPGIYRVGFPYRDETERLAQVGRIETVTGLELEVP